MFIMRVFVCDAVGEKVIDCASLHTCFLGPTHDLIISTNAIIFFYWKEER